MKTVFVYHSFIDFESFTIYTNASILNTVGCLRVTFLNYYSDYFITLSKQIKIFWKKDFHICNYRMFEVKAISDINHHLRITIFILRTATYPRPQEKP